MKFTGCTCAYCSSSFVEADDVVVCPVCGSPHHRECWKENTCCANAPKHDDGFIWIFPEELRPKPEKPAMPQAIETNYTFKNGENAVMCPHCKALNYGNDAYCMRCRKPLSEEAQAAVPEASQNMNQDNMGNMPPQDGPYNYFQQFGGVRPDIMIDGIPAVEYADYIGEKKSGRYIRRFLNMERFGRKISVSVCAFIFGPIWFFYRKMFKEGLLYLLALLLTAGVMTWAANTDYAKEIYTEMAAHYDELITGEISQAQLNEIILEKQEEILKRGISKQDEFKETVYTVVEVVQLALMLGMAFFADLLYKRKVKADILRIREECSDMMTYRHTLHVRGGTSTGGAIIAAVAFAAISFIQLIPGYYYMFSQIM